MDINSIDLCAFHEGEDHKIMAVAALDDGTFWKSESAPYKGAGGQIAPQVAAKFPDLFPTAKDAEMWFIWTHFRNMKFKQNTAGQAYPG
jgi:hypothetical protein